VTSLLWLVGVHPIPLGPWETPVPEHRNESGLFTDDFMSK
jgi:hypothetical protein